MKRNPGHLQGTLLRRVNFIVFIKNGFSIEKVKKFYLLWKFCHVSSGNRQLCGKFWNFWDKELPISFSYGLELVSLLWLYYSHYVLAVELYGLLQMFVVIGNLRILNRSIYLISQGRFFSFIGQYQDWIGLVRFLWHTNHCRLFNANPFLFLYIKYTWFGWLRFYDTCI